MESINWNKVYEKAANFGTGLADFFNGMFAGSQGLRLFDDFGRTLSSTINTVVYVALNFADTLKWGDIGKNIARGITSAFENWDAASTAKAINKWVQGVFDLITNAITNVDWMTVYDKITEFLENIDINQAPGMALSRDVVNAVS